MGSGIQGLYFPFCLVSFFRWRRGGGGAVPIKNNA